MIIEINQSGKSTHGGSYHRGDFSKPVSTVNFSSRSAAFDASDTIKYVIPLNLPAPSVSLSAPSTVTSPNTAEVTLVTTDLSGGIYNNTSGVLGANGFDTLIFDSTPSSGTKSQTKTVSDVWFKQF